MCIVFHLQLSVLFIFFQLLGGELRELTGIYRVLKWWRHKNEISEIMGFVRIFLKNNAQEA